MTKDEWKKENPLPSLDHLPADIRQKVLDHYNRAAESYADAGYSGLFSDGRAGDRMTEILSYLEGYSRVMPTCWYEPEEDGEDDE